jgi:hypothetical protein
MSNLPAGFFDSDAGSVPKSTAPKGQKRKHSPGPPTAPHADQDIDAFLSALEKDQTHSSNNNNNNEKDNEEKDDEEKDGDDDKEDGNDVDHDEIVEALYFVSRVEQLKQRMERAKTGKRDRKEQAGGGKGKEKERDGGEGKTASSEIDLFDWRSKGAGLEAEEE